MLDRFPDGVIQVLARIPDAAVHLRGYEPRLALHHLCVGRPRLEQLVGFLWFNGKPVHKDYRSDALIHLLVHFDCVITCIDPREEWMAKLPKSAKLTTIQTSDMPSVVKNLPDDAFVILMSMGHATDSPVLIEILRTRKFPYLGVIGSDAKANVLRRDIAAAGLPEEAQHAFRCPIGIEIGTNHPYEIALSVIAQLIQTRDARRGTSPLS